MSLSLGFVPRARRPLGALDLGLGLLQAHRGPVYRVFLLQVGVILALVLPFTWSQPAWALLWILWLTPWLDRGTLHVLSRRVMGQEAGVITFLADWRTLHGRGLGATLLWRRLSPQGSFLLPIWLLEAQRGAAFRSRAQALLRQTSGTALLLGITSLVFGVTTLFGILGLLQMLVPKGVPLDFFEGLGNQLATPWFAWAFTGFGLVAFAVMEPFFAAAGFALYLNRRTQLEGWDLEQAFRRLAARLAAGGRALLLCLALAGGAVAQDAEVPPPSEPAPQVQPAEAPRLPEDPARKTLERILEQDPDLRRTREVKVWKYRPTGKEAGWLRVWLDRLFAPRPGPQDQAEAPGQLPAWWDVAAVVAKAMLVGGLVGLLLYLLVRFHAVRYGTVRPEEDDEAPASLAGLDVRPEALPRDISGEARRHFAAGDPRGALALLYRGALAWLLHGLKLSIPGSATEGDCLRAALPVLGVEPAAAFEALTAAWMRMAYLGEAPDAARMEGLLAAWDRHFRGAP